jgi:TorA maturation chaperone TorD
LLTSPATQVASAESSAFLVDCTRLLHSQLVSCAPEFDTAFGRTAQTEYDRALALLTAASFESEQSRSA